MRPEDLKKQFASREIVPHEAAWDRLATRLDNNDVRRKKKPFFYWLGGIAAGVAVLLAFYAGRLSLINSIEQEQIVVSPLNANDEPDVPVGTGLITDRAQGHTHVVDVTIEASISPNNKPKDFGTTKSAATTVQKNQTDKQYPVKTGLAVYNQVTEQKKPLASPLIVEAHRRASFTDNNSISSPDDYDAETDRLLREAWTELDLDKPLQETKYSLSAEQLLRETEWDMEFDKRHKLERSLNEKLGNAKRDALAFIGIGRK